MCALTGKYQTSLFECFSFISDPFFIFYFSFFDNELTGECCPYLMEALTSEHCSLTELDLSVNELGQEGALLLGRALSQPGCLMENLK